MASAFHDYTKGFMSARKEKKRRAQGAERNRNLPPEVLSKVNRLKKEVQRGNMDASYELALLYLDGSEVGYDPDKGREYLEIGARKDHFNSLYALARYYRGHWSYQHVDAFQSMVNYAVCKNCKNADPTFVREAARAYYNDFGRESTEDGLQVWFKVDIPIN